jgi:hypothetical protein
MVLMAETVAATAEGLQWPYCVAENNGTYPFDVSNPGHGVDGRTNGGIDEVYQIKAASYDTRNNADDPVPLKTTMDAPSYWGRPFNQVKRFGESHDMVSGQNPTSIRMPRALSVAKGFRWRRRSAR